jgi:ribonuclease HI
MGTEVSLLGGYGFEGVTLGVDGSCKDGKMGSGCCKFREEGAGKCARVGREEEGTSSSRPELGGVVLALQSAAALSEDVLLLCDNEAVLCAIKKWVGQGGKATLATASDADILREIVCLLTQRVRAGRATFLIKVKSHCGEPIKTEEDRRVREGRRRMKGPERLRGGTDQGETVEMGSAGHGFRKRRARLELSSGQLPGNKQSGKPECWASGVSKLQEAGGHVNTTTPTRSHLAAGLQSQERQDQRGDG